MANRPGQEGAMPFDLAALLAGSARKYDLHERYLNQQLVRMLRVIGYDVDYKSAKGAYLFDAAGKEYLDLLGGIAVAVLGHAHPEVSRAIARQAKALVHVSNLFANRPALEGTTSPPDFWSPRTATRSW